MLQHSRAPQRANRLHRRVALLLALAGAALAGAQTTRPIFEPHPPAVADPARAARPLSSFEPAPAPATRPARSLDDLPDIKTQYRAALELYEDNHPADAIPKLDAALGTPDGECYEVLYLMAMCKARLGRLGEARMAAERAALLRHESGDVHFLLASLYEAQDQFERAITEYRTATLSAERELDNPRVTASWMRLGRLLINAGYLTAAAEALERFDQALWEDSPDHRGAPEVAVLIDQRGYGALELRLDLLNRLDRKDDALRVAEWAVSERPNDAYLRRCYVRSMLDAGQARRALEYIRARPGDSAQGDHNGLLLLAVEAARTARDGLLEKWVDEAVADIGAGRRLPAARALARRLDGVGDHKAAAKLWRALSAQQPDSAETSWALAVSLRESGDLPGALDTLIAYTRSSDAAERREKEAAGEADAARGATSREAGRSSHRGTRAMVPDAQLSAWMTPARFAVEPSKAIESCNTRPDRDFATDFVVGATAAAARQIPLAEQSLKRCLDVRPDFAMAQVVWGRMLTRDCQWEEARQHALDAVKLAPDLPAAHALLADVLAGLDENEQAETEYKAAIRLAPEDPAYPRRLAEHYQRLNDARGASRRFQEAAQLDPTDEKAIEGLIETYLDDRKLEAARGRLEKAEEADLSEDVLRRIRTSVRFAQAPFFIDHVTELARQYQQHPLDYITGLKLTAGLVAHRRYDEALAAVQQVLRQVPDEEAAIEWLARIQSRRLAFAETIEAMESLVHRYPHRSAYLDALADAYLADFRVEDARNTMRRRLEAKLEPPERDRQRERLLATYELFMDYAGGLELLGGWLKDDPHDDELLVQKFLLMVETGQREEAVKQARAWLDGEAGDGERRLKFLQVCVAARDFRTAETNLREWIKEQPTTLTWTELLIQEVLLRDGRPDDALQVASSFVPQTLQQAITARLWMARCHARAGRADAAVAELDALLDERPVQSDQATRSLVRQELITALTRAGEYDKALARVERWFDKSARDDRYARFENLQYKRVIFQTANRLDDALAVNRELLEMDPTDPGQNNDLGYTLVDANRDVARGTEMIRFAVAFSPLNSAFLDSMAWAYYKAGDFDAARKFLVRAVRLRTGQDATLYDHLGDVEMRRSDATAARAAWTKALELATSAPQEPRDVRMTELTAALREKLAALEKSQPPALAPLGGEPVAK